MKQYISVMSALLILSLPVQIFAEESAADLVARAVSAAPASVSDQATVMGSDGSILREGSNGWTCTPDTMPGDRAPMCNDSTFMSLMHAIGSQGEFTASRIGISYMLQGDHGAGVSNSSPYHPDPKNAPDYVETGPHMMIVVPKELLEGMTDDPASGGPYVMWKDTPYAHIMVPIAGQ